MGKKRVVRRQQHNKPIEIPARIEKLSMKQMLKKTIKAEVGQPGKFIHIDLKKVYRLALLGFDNREFAEHFDVKYETWTQWVNPTAKTFKPDLSETLEYGRSGVIAEVADRLLQRAKGYKHRATKFIVIDGKIVRQEYIEHYPPDTAAATFIMKNKRAKDWKDKQIIEGSADGPPVGQTIVNVITTDDKLKKLAADKLKKENKK